MLLKKPLSGGGISTKQKKIIIAHTAPGSGTSFSDFFLWKLNLLLVIWISRCSAAIIIKNMLQCLIRSMDDSTNDFDFFTIMRRVIMPCVGCTVALKAIPTTCWIPLSIIYFQMCALADKTVLKRVRVAFALQWVCGIIQACYITIKY